MSGLTWRCELGNQRPSATGLGVLGQHSGKFVADDNTYAVVPHRSVTNQLQALVPAQSIHNALPTSQAVEVSEKWVGR